MIINHKKISVGKLPWLNYPKHDLNAPPPKTVKPYSCIKKYMFVIWIILYSWYLEGDVNVFCHQGWGAGWSAEMLALAEWDPQAKKSLRSPALDSLLVLLLLHAGLDVLQEVGVAHTLFHQILYRWVARSGGIQETRTTISTAASGYGIKAATSTLQVQRRADITPLRQRPLGMWRRIDYNRLRSRWYIKQFMCARVYLWILLFICKLCITNLT